MQEPDEKVIRWTKERLPIPANDNVYRWAAFDAEMERLRQRLRNLGIYL